MADLTPEQQLDQWRHEAQMAALADLKEDIKGTNDRLDLLNGRTRAVEQKVAVLESREPVNPKAAKAGTIGGAIGAGIVAGGISLWEWFRR